MYCPICGQQQVSDVTRFCSRCGFLLTGVAQVIANNGNVPQILPDQIQSASSARIKGIKMGGALMLSGIILTPVTAILLDDTRLGDYVIPLVAILTFMGGLIAILFSAIFLSGTSKYVLPSNAAAGNKLGNANPLFQGDRVQNALPPQSANFNPVNSNYYQAPILQKTAGEDWRESNTNELVMPPSVTEETTKLLNQQDQK